MATSFLCAQIISCIYSHLTNVIYLFCCLNFFSEKSIDNSKKPSIFAKKRSHADEVPDTSATVLTDFGIKSCAIADNTCYCCFQTITEGKVGIKKTLGTITLWYHAKCFEKHQLTLGWNEAVESFPGFNKLSSEKRNEMKKLFG